MWLIYASGQGVTMGAHRLFCHKAFKAKLWLRVTLLWLHTLAGQVRSISFFSSFLMLILSHAWVITQFFIKI
jgi:fatty-acid desaturase